MKLVGTKIAAAGVIALALASGSAAAVGNGPLVYANGAALVQIRADGSGATTIATDAFVLPRLSPDGTQIAFLRTVAPVRLATST